MSNILVIILFNIFIFRMLNILNKAHSRDCVRQPSLDASGYRVCRALLHVWAIADGDAGPRGSRLGQAASPCCIDRAVNKIEG